MDNPPKSDDSPLLHHIKWINFWQENDSLYFLDKKMERNNPNRFNQRELNLIMSDQITQLNQALADFGLNNDKNIQMTNNMRATYAFERPNPPLNSMNHPMSERLFQNQTPVVGSRKHKLSDSSISDTKRQKQNQSQNHYNFTPNNQTRQVIENMSQRNSQRQIVNNQPSVNINDFYQTPNSYSGVEGAQTSHIHVCPPRPANSFSEYNRQMTAYQLSLRSNNPMPRPVINMDLYGSQIMQPENSHNNDKK